MYEEQHKIWELRHSACKRCHASSEPNGKTDEPCICGPEPCKKCGYRYADVYLLENAYGCGKCSPAEKDVKTIHLESAWMMLCVECPYCDASNMIDGNNTIGGFDGDALECCSCKKLAWLGEGECDNESIDNVMRLCKGKS